MYSSKTADSKYIIDYKMAASEGVKSQKNRDIRYKSIKGYIDEAVK